MTAFSFIPRQEKFNLKLKSCQARLKNLELTENQKQFYSKQARKPQRNLLEPGIKGFLVTCNFKERDSIRECYHLLNDYYKKSQKELEVEGKDEEKPDNDDDDDISSQIQDQIEKTNKQLKDRMQLFQSIDTGVQNCLFIKTSIEDPIALGSAIIRDLAETKIKRTKVTLRLLPIQTVCKAKMEEITDAAGLLFDKYFLKEPVTFGINYNKRFNNDIKRDDVIKELADIVSMKNPLHKVNLKEPQLSVIVEIIKGCCLLSVIPDYHKFKKYNVNELWEKREKAQPSDEVSSQDSEVKAEAEEKISSQEDEVEAVAN